MPQVNETDAAQLDAANASGKPTVVFVHGLWLLSSSWDRWRSLFGEAGYGTVALSWPGDGGSVAEARANPNAVAGVTLAQVAEYQAAALGQLREKPAVVGHSFGGLLAQMMAGRGLSNVTVAIDPAPFRGVLQLPLSTLKASFPVLRNPLKRHRSVMLTAEEFRYAFANVVTDEEARSVYQEFAVPGTSSPIFSAAMANVNPWTDVKVDTETLDRGPLLMIGGEKDHTVPWSVTRGAFRRQQRNAGLTELAEAPNRGHSLTIDSGWQEVADVALAFVRRFMEP
jgi:pimeloyl-ACP methyl ester carboxylesterase